MASFNEGFLPFPKGFSTVAIHGHQEPEKWNSLAVVPPIITATAFKQVDINGTPKYEYARLNTPTRDTLERCLAKLENAQYGLSFSSGNGALTAIIATCKSGDHLLLANHVYGGTWSLVVDICTRFNIEYDIFDIDDDFEKLTKPNTKMILIETPSNPILKVVDIKATAEKAKKHGILLIVDNTFLTPYFQRPLDFGADISLYSLTKYFNGHSDVVMGSLATNNETLYNNFKIKQVQLGLVPSAFDCYQVLRSIKTLELRMQKHFSNSLCVAKFLEKHPKIEKVIHPGLKSHPKHELTKRQTCGHSGVIGVYVKNATKQDCGTFLQSLKTVILSNSLGGYESAATLPCLGSHKGMAIEEREKIEIYDNFIRFSIGLEDVDDIISDINQALDKI